MLNLLCRHPKGLNFLPLLALVMSVVEDDLKRSNCPGQRCVSHFYQEMHKENGAGVMGRGGSLSPPSFSLKQTPRKVLGLHVGPYGMIG